jgi:hypothetical protein
MKLMNFRLSDSDKKIIEKAAKKRHITQSGLIRLLVFAGIKNIDKIFDQTTESKKQEGSIEAV